MTGAGSQAIGRRRATQAKVARVAALSAVAALGALSALCLNGCTTLAHTPRAVQPQWVYAGPAIALKRNGLKSTVETDNAAILRDPVSAIDALRYFNAKRAEVGLPPMRNDTDVRIAAVAHVRYLQANHTFGHSETAGAPGFTGADASARIQAQRQRRHQSQQSAVAASEVVSMQSNGRPASEAITQLFASPYHRGVILFDWVNAGVAVSQEVGGAHTDADMSMPRSLPPSDAQFAVADFADFGQAIASNELIAYPFNGQSDAPVAWTDDELPDPMGDDERYRGRLVGYPISLSGGPNAHIVLQRVDLKDGAGRTVPCHIAALTAADALRNTAICTPFEPLRALTDYTVRAVGTLTEGRYIVDVPFDLTWRFRTGR